MTADTWTWIQTTKFPDVSAPVASFLVTCGSPIKVMEVRGFCFLRVSFGKFIFYKKRSRLIHNSESSDWGVGGLGWWVVMGWTGHPGEPRHTIRLWQKQNGLWPRDDGPVAREDRESNPDWKAAATDRLWEAGSSRDGHIAAWKLHSNIISCYLKAWNMKQVFK